MLITSCAKEELRALETNLDEAEARTAPQPDLVITYFRSSLPDVQGPCPGPPKPNASCSGGATTPPTFQFKAIVENIGTADIPPTPFFEISWNLFGSGSTSTTINQGIRAGESIVITSPIFSLPCPSGPPPYLLVDRHFFSVIDPVGVINESNENNNNSTRVVMCDDE